MTERAILESLLARVLEGTGSDRELDAEIWIASERGASDLAAPPWRYLGGGCWSDDSEPYGHNKVYAPPYTTSLDAALTLVPEGGDGRELYKETRCWFRFLLTFPFLTEHGNRNGLAKFTQMINALS